MATSNALALFNPRTGCSWPFEVTLVAAPDDGGPLRLPPGNGFRRSQIDGSCTSMWRYGAALRIDGEHRVELGEGGTPLIRRRWRNRDVLFKLDYLMPSGSFKDRGTAVLFNALSRARIRQVIEDSSGNTGASYATYGNACDIACRIYVPATVPRGKLQQAQLLGADVIAVEGSRDDVAAMARRDPWGTYVGHAWHPLFLEGTKTLAFELWEQLGFRAPEWVLAPLGQGSNVIGLFDGFRELMTAGSIERLPRIIGVQASACAPFALALKQGITVAPSASWSRTLADGIAAGKPIRSTDVLEAIRTSGGTILTVAEEEIVAALGDLLQHGLFIEPTAAVTMAALEQLLAAGAIGRSDTVAVVLTGSGFKAIEIMTAALDAARKGGGCHND